MALTATVRAEIGSSYTSVLDQGTATFPASVSSIIQFTNGSGANQVDRLFSDQRTITASSNEDLDLAGSLTDAFGATLTFVRVKAIIVKAAAGNTNNVVVGGAASNQFVGPFGAATHTIAVKPGGALIFVAPDATGWAVTAGTGDLLRIANSGAGTSVTYDIQILGASS